MKQIFSLLTLIYSTCVIAQTPNAKIPDENLIQSRSRFYNTYWKDPELALAYAQEIAVETDNKWFLRDMLHSDIYFIFHDKVEKKYKESAIQNGTYNPITWEDEYKTFLGKPYQTLTLLESDQNTLLSKSARPILYWADITCNNLNNQESRKLIKDFIASELMQNDIFYNSAGLYALLIYQSISDNEGLIEDARSLLMTIIQKSPPLQVDENINSASNLSLYKRAWYRYLYACANHLMAKELLEQGKNEEAINYQKAAFDFSPDITDQRFSYAYSTEKYLLFEDEDDALIRDYLKKLGNNTEITLNELSKIALKEPVKYKDSLKTYYKEHFPMDEEFPSYWNRLINSALDECPPFKFKDINGSLSISPLTYGKWLLIEFWGTWCGPCRENHPELQDFLEYVQHELSDEIKILTFACKDSEEKVISYMNKFNYSFPVSVSDGSIESTFNIEGYPTLLLISPEGNYLKIPVLSYDWVGFVKQYASLQ